MIPIGEDGDEKYLCINCNTLHDYAGQCHYCGVLNAGISFEVSYYVGCIMCKGSTGADDS